MRAATCFAASTSPFRCRSIGGAGAREVSTRREISPGSWVFRLTTRSRGPGATPQRRRICRRRSATPTFAARSSSSHARRAGRSRIDVVVLVDDVSTTGATLDACARVAEGGGRARGARSYRSASRERTTVAISSATTSFACSPSITNPVRQRPPGGCSCPARGTAARDPARSGPGPRLSVERPSPGRCPARIVSCGFGRNRCASASHAGFEALRLAVRDARRRVPIAQEHEPALEPPLDVRLAARTGWR